MQTAIGLGITKIVDVSWNRGFQMLKRNKVEETYNPEEYELNYCKANLHIGY